MSGESRILNPGSVTPSRPPLRLLGRALGLLVLFSCAAPADEIGEALDASMAAQRAARESQARINKIEDETQALRQKRIAAEWKVLQMSAYAQQLEQEAAAEERRRADLKAELDRVVSTGTDLMPLMQRMVAELDEFVGRDLPFLLETRRQRVRELQALLEEPRRTHAEKYRRVLEAYRTEVDYGYSLGAEDGEAECGGRREAVSLVRVGRAALYCLSADGERAGYWDAAARKFQGVDGDAAKNVRRALAMAREQAPPELLVLPVQAAKMAP